MAHILDYNFPRDKELPSFVRKFWKVPSVLVHFVICGDIFKVLVLVHFGILCRSNSNTNWLITFPQFTCTVGHKHSKLWYFSKFYEALHPTLLSSTNICTKIKASCKTAYHFQVYENVCAWFKIYGLKIQKPMGKEMNMHVGLAQKDLADLSISVHIICT